MGIVHVAKLKNVSGVVLSLCLLSWAAGAEGTGLTPAAPQPASEQMQGGLAVRYAKKFVRHVDDCPTVDDSRQGPALSQLDWDTGEGEVLTSGENNGVCAHISGYLRFPAPGVYILTAKSNDGLRVTLSDRVIIEDPDVHSDRFSDEVRLRIEHDGWYELRIVYFERKATSTLELYWLPPGKAQLELVPKHAFGHITP